MDRSKAAAQLWRLAQATTFVRLGKQAGGDEEEFARLYEAACDANGVLQPTDADHATVAQGHPDLVRLAAGTPS